MVIPLIENVSSLSFFPSISIIIPTFNSEQTLRLCLGSIRNQDYPKEKIEVIVADGGSKDKTLEIVEEFKVDRTISNPLKTGEAGKAIGVKNAKNEIIALIDSDNILEYDEWLKRMVEPFKDKEIVGVEPLFYTYRKQDSYITRYCALLGMNDPLCLFLGNYDRYCILTNRWTEMPLLRVEEGNYLKVRLYEKSLPTIGANGFLVRRSELIKCSIGDYLFDIDIVYELVKSGHDVFAKVKIGIIHLFSGSISTFIKKQKRRIRDYSYYKSIGMRKYPWSTLSKGKIIKFIIYTVLVVPLCFQAIKGYIRKPDYAWLFHIPACFLTLVLYGFGITRNILFEAQQEDRSRWGT